MLRNTIKKYGLVSVVIHWMSALTIVGLFVLGWWMLTLTYYDPWYRLGPWWHKSFGLLLLILTVVRVVWVLISPGPKFSGTGLGRFAARLGHWLLYSLLFVVLVSGYLISTADGRPISVFDWFSVPAFTRSIPYQADVAGTIHWYAACILIILAAGHAFAALWHHFVLKDSTLTKMFSINPEKKS